MGYPDYDRQTMNRDLAKLSRWVDQHNSHKPMLLQLYERCTKVYEERGEVESALIGYSAQNPRKGQTHTIDDVEKELLDQAVTALAAVEHIHGNTGVAMNLLRDHLGMIMRRADLE